MTSANVTNDGQNFRGGGGYAARPVVGVIIAIIQGAQA
jgi:hypothetical protein